MSELPETVEKIGVVAAAHAQSSLADFHCQRIVSPVVSGRVEDGPLHEHELGHAVESCVDQERTPKARGVLFFAATDHLDKEIGCLARKDGRVIARKRYEEVGSLEQ